MRLFDRIGVELEGVGWPQGRGTPGWRHDGSVEIEGHYDEGEVSCECGDPCDCSSAYCCNCESRKETSAGDIGEVASPAFRSLGSVQEWLRKTWPSESNETCGLHVHVSFPPGLTGALASDKFLNYALRKLEAWGRSHKLVKDDSAFWHRLEGGNSYCLKENHSERQIMGGGTRYTMFNFAAWHEHKTVECRLFPMFEGGAEVACEAVAVLLDIYQSYLKRKRSRKRAELSLELEQQTPPPEVEPIRRELVLPPLAGVVRRKESEIAGRGTNTVRESEVVQCA